MVVDVLLNGVPDLAPCGPLADEYIALLEAFNAGQPVELDSLVAAVHSELASNPLFCWRRLHTDAYRIDLVVDLIRRIQSQHLPCEPFHSSSSSYVFPLPDPPAITGLVIPCLAAPPSLAIFQSCEHERPFILRDYASRWPALKEHPWASTEYLLSLPVEVGRDYRTDDWTQKLIEWDTFLASLDDSSDAPMYLAQHSLLMQFPSLRADIQVPDYVYAAVPRPAGCEPPGNDEQLVINAWLGPKDTISPAHTDPYFNMYVQVVGRKMVWLAPPSCGPCRNALGPGDVLYIPAGWWHAMRAESRSFSVSMWF
ncbi:hypothetical protein C8F01DRAFT_1209770 [Mycena amicta]|nr:hypothetical protein C8F01DRAFT_1209770 [Mycena amicta]